MRAGHRLASECLARGLVLPSLMHLRFNTELVERALEEERLSGDAGHRQMPRRCQHDRVGGAGEVIFAGASLGEVYPDVFAGLT